jgi:hypothetical protein
LLQQCATKVEEKKHNLGGGLMAFFNKSEVEEIFGRLNVMWKFASPSLVNGARANN